MRPIALALIAVTFVVLPQTALSTSEPEPGCYVPKRGFAASICTDTPACSQQLGVFRIVLKNPLAPAGVRKLILSGTFRGRITQPPTADGVTVLSHLLIDKSLEGTITTRDDVAYPVPGGDGVTTLAVEEVLNLDSGAGIYAGLIGGGQVVLTGTFGLTTGINTFSVVRNEGEVCFQ